MRHIEPLTPEQSRRVEANMGLLGAFVRRYPPPRYIPYEDYYSELSVGLVISASTYREDGGSSFSTWTYHQFMGVRSNIMRKYLLPALNEKHVGDDFGFSWLATPEPTNREIDLSDSDREFLMNEFSTLAPDDQDLLRGDVTIRELGRRLGVSHTAMSSRKRNAAVRMRRKLRAVLDEEWAREEGFFRPTPKKSIELAQEEV